MSEISEKSELVFSARTQYSDVYIYQNKNELHLKFDADSRAVQSVIDINQPYSIKMENLQYLMGILMFIPPPQNILILGIGGGTLVHFLRHHFPDSHITGVDLDEELIDIAQQHLMLPPASDNTHYAYQDAQQFIAETGQQFDLVVVDIFDGSESPGWIKTRQTAQQLSTILTAKGAVAYNLLIESDKEFAHFYAQLREQFNQQTLCLESDENENILIYALNFQVSQHSMTHNIQLAQQVSSQYSIPMTEILKVIYSINPVDSGVI